jgi:hypothetical protein
MESFDLLPTNQYILVRVVPSCVHFVNICLNQISLLSSCSPKILDIFFLRKLYVGYANYNDVDSDWHWDLFT